MFLLIKANCGLLRKSKFYMNTHIRNMSKFSHCFSGEKIVCLSGYQRYQWVRCEAKFLLLNTYPRLKIPHGSILVTVHSAGLPWKAFCLERSAKGIIYFSCPPLPTSSDLFSSIKHCLIHMCRSSHKRENVDEKNLEKQWNDAEEKGSTGSGVIIILNAGVNEEEENCRLSHTSHQKWSAWLCHFQLLWQAMNCGVDILLQYSQIPAQNRCIFYAFLQYLGHFSTSLRPGKGV